MSAAPALAPDSPVRVRLGELRLELERGRRQLDMLDRERLLLRETLLRICGAIEVLEELEGAA